jgi:transposase
LPPHLKAQITRELDRLELLLGQIEAVEIERDARLSAMKPDGMNADAVRSPPAMLVNLNRIGPEIAAVLWSEGLYRSFANRKQVAAYAGLAPTPWQSGSVAASKGFPKRAIQGCGQHCCNLPGYGCATRRNQRWRVGSTSASRATAAACASQRSWR